ncbi:MAG TPA: ABC transporter ATP-binding protein [Candidatus Omnitrophota bacterium]|nr:ABC transporter ATP-binding protein [Candidatus Omnitrophota bacterium]
MSNKVFEIIDAHYSYLAKYPALNGINMEVSQGEKISVIGANGCGKSTLLHIMDGLIFPDRGEARAFGRELTEKAFNDDLFSADFRKKVGLVFQNPDIQLFCPTVREDIVFGPVQLELDKVKFERRFEELIGLLSIEELLERSPHQLSIGEKRKVALASTLIVDPEVIILDEPTAGLDPLTTRNIIDLLIKENNSGKTIITSTHDLHIVEEISDTVHVFNRDRRIVASGKPADILGDRQLLQQNNLVHVHGHMHHEDIHVHAHSPLTHHPEDL